MKSIRVVVTLLSIIPALAFAQGAQRSAIASSDVLSQISMFSYQAGPESDLLFRGTPIAATAQGKGSVEFEKGNAQISVKVKDLPVPTSLGPYTTYVLWALTPDGRAANQGVLAGAEGGKGDLKTQYGASQFALIITAEPHFAVTAPSNMIVLYNVADKVKGQESKVTTLTERSEYSKLTPIKVDAKTNPAELAARVARGREIVVLDVRERDAYAAGHVPGARHLPRGQLELRVNDELPDPTARIVTVCEFGKISTLAAATLRDLGFLRSAALDGGMKAWRESGLPLEAS